MTRAVRLPIQTLQDLPLEVHRVLSDVPLRDVTAIDLPGGGPGRTIADVRRLEERGAKGGAVTRGLFGLRLALGRLFGWDTAGHAAAALSYRSHLPPELAARSQREPGSNAGPFQVLYELDNEALLEIRNATVHAFLCMVLRPNGSGYRLFWAVYVLPISWLTPFYMALIEPFRRYVVYPSRLGSVVRAWRKAYLVPAE